MIFVKLNLLEADDTGTDYEMWLDVERVLALVRVGEKTRVTCVGHTGLLTVSETPVQIMVMVDKAKEGTFAKRHFGS